MQVQNANDLYKFMSDLREWAVMHSFESIVAAIESAEKTSFTASELIIKYGEVLRFLKDKRPQTIPAQFRDNWDAAIEVATKSVQTVEYEEKT